MSERIINFYNLPGGTPDDVTSVVFSDATDSYGLRKVSDESVVLAANTAMPRISEGHYQLTVTDLVEGDEYEYGLKWVYRGNTYRRSNSFTAGVSSIVDDSYVDQTYMETVRGVVNIRRWSNKGGTQVSTNVTAVDAARSDAKTEIDGILMKRYPIPLTGTTDSDVKRLRKWAERIASYYLYIGRGLQEDDATGNQLRTEYKDTIDEIERFGTPSNLEGLDADEYEIEMPNAPRLVT